MCVWIQISLYKAICRKLVFLLFTKTCHFSCSAALIYIYPFHFKYNHIEIRCALTLYKKNQQQPWIHYTYVNRLEHNFHSSERSFQSPTMYLIYTNKQENVHNYIVVLTSACRQDDQINQVGKARCISYVAFILVSSYEV